MFGLNYYSMLPNVVRDELSQLVEGVKGYVLNQHNDDGSHAAITSNGNITASGYGTFNQYRLFCKATAVTLVDSTETVLSWDAPADDGLAFAPPQYDSGWNYGKILDTAVDPTILTVPVDGMYAVTYKVRFSAAAAGQRYVYLSTYRNGNAPSDLGQDTQAPSATVATSCGTTLYLPMKAGYGFRVKAYQSSGGPLAIATGFLNSWLQVQKVS